MATAKRMARKGSKLRIHYICKDADGTVLESTHDQKPAPQITLGHGDVLDALEKALLGMQEGETKIVTLEPQDAFGDYEPDLVDEVPREQLDMSSAPEVGMEFEFTDEDGEVYSGVVTEVTPETVTIDGNHPLAGMILTFELTLVEILG